MKLALGNSLATQRIGGGAAWSPLALSPLIWCDATQLILSDGDPVSEFTDFSGNGNHFVQATTSNKPTYKASGINSLPAIEGDGVDDMMTLASIGEVLDWWAYIVFKPVTMAASKELWAVPDFPAAGSIYRLLETNSSTTININQGTGAMPSSITLASGVKRALRLEGHITSISYQADNGSPISITGLDGNYPSTANDGRLAAFNQRIFARGDPGLYFNAQIGEIILGSGSLSSENLTLMWTYLNGKWGTAIP